MSKKITFIAPGIALVAMLVYLILTSTPPEKPPVVADKPALPEYVTTPTDQPVIEEPSPPRVHPAQEVSLEVSTDDAVSTVYRQQNKHAPELEPEIREALGEILNTSSEGLLEETRNGASSVNLQGRFQTAPVATVDENGNVQITDYSHLPKASPQP